MTTFSILIKQRQQSELTLTKSIKSDQQDDLIFISLAVQDAQCIQKNQIEIFAAYKGSLSKTDLNEIDTSQELQDKYYEQFLGSLKETIALLKEGVQQCKNDKSQTIQTLSPLNFNFIETLSIKQLSSVLNSLIELRKNQVIFCSNNRPKQSIQQQIVKKKKQVSLKDLEKSKSKSLNTNIQKLPEKRNLNNQTDQKSKSITLKWTPSARYQKEVQSQKLDDTNQQEISANSANVIRSQQIPKSTKQQNSVLDELPGPNKYQQKQTFQKVPGTSYFLRSDVLQRAYDELFLKEGQVERQGPVIVEKQLSKTDSSISSMKEVPIITPVIKQRQQLEVPDSQTSLSALSGSDGYLLLPVFENLLNEAEFSAVSDSLLGGIVSQVVADLMPQIVETLKE